ncbi:MAG: sulfate ABC transporter permease subunit CysT [Wenzhouxiangella sp.]|nr:sulfate ABC transporter permease subunit CysT [Wenzhouxiangella sp.]MCH8478761.1 sulfate ABC transporter permease subunit CysT [Wenzhouxiangella sp.]
MNTAVLPRARRSWRAPSALPGFGLTMGITLTYMGLLIILPLAALMLYSTGQSAESFVNAAFDRRSLASYRVSFGASLAAAVINGVFGTIVAWTLVRYRFPGRRILDAMVDLPFALPTAVSGIALTTLFATTGPFGQWLDQLGIQVAFTRLGIIAALTLISMPFVVRTLQPAIEDLDAALEEASASMGAGRWRTLTQVIFPILLPALLTGFTLAFARSLGEYGSVIFIAGNMPYQTEIAPLLIVIKLEQFDYLGATAIAATLLVASLILLVLINLLQLWHRRRITEGR